MSTLTVDAVVAAAAEAEDEYFDDDVDRAEEEAEWRRRLPEASCTEDQQAPGELNEAIDENDSEGIMESLSSNTHISLKLTVSCVAVAVLMYGVFRRLIFICDAFVPGRLAGATVLLLAAGLIWREQQESKLLENVHASSTDRQHACCK